MHNTPPYLTVVIPAYNEQHRLPNSLDQVFGFLAAANYSSEVVVVDDGSTDNTPRILKAAEKRFPQLRVLQNRRNRGKGYSVRKGVLYSTGKYLLFTDADLSAPIQEADKLLAPIQSGECEIAIGSRALDPMLIGVHQSPFRELAGRIFNSLVRLLTGLNIRDTQCGFKAYQGEVARRIFARHLLDGFSFDVETLYLAHKSRLKIQEMPVCWNHSPDTKVRMLRHSVSMFKDLLRIRWNDFLGRYATEPQPLCASGKLR